MRTLESDAKPTPPGENFVLHAMSVQPSAVAHNAIWRELIRKENEIIERQKKSTFRLNVRSIKLMATKPESARGQADLSMEELQAKLNLDKASERQVFGVVPPVTEVRTGVPLTASAEIGWFLNRRTHARIARFRQRWQKPRNTCDVTQYADDFHAMTRVSPFSTKSQRGKAAGE